MFGKGTDVQKTNISDQVKDNRWLFVIVSLGIGLLITGVVLWNETLVAIGAAFIIAGGVGIYMMLATRQVAKQLHLRFNEQNEILDTQTGILKDIASSQKEMGKSLKEITSSQKEIASSQKQNHSEMIDVLKRIETGFSNLGEGLKKIENKL